jgi:hypothetical protein
MTSFFGPKKGAASWIDERKIKLAFKQYVREFSMRPSF